MFENAARWGPLSELDFSTLEVIGNPEYYKSQDMGYVNKEYIDNYIGMSENVVVEIFKENGAYKYRILY